MIRVFYWTGMGRGSLCTSVKRQICRTEGYVIGKCLLKFDECADADRLKGELLWCIGWNLHDFSSVGHDSSRGNRFEECSHKLCGLFSYKAYFWDIRNAPFSRVNRNILMFQSENKRRRFHLESSFEAARMWLCMLHISAHCSYTL